jgi:hypothetical protein
LLVVLAVASNHIDLAKKTGGQISRREDGRDKADNHHCEIDFLEGFEAMASRQVEEFSGEKVKDKKQDKLVAS